MTCDDVAAAGLAVAGARSPVVVMRRRAVTAAAAAVQRAAAEAAQDRLRFLMRLDHELKNPLTAMRAGLANIDQAGAAPGFGAARGRSAALVSVSAQADRITRLVSDLRKLADLETQQIETAPVDLPGLLYEVAEAAAEIPGARERVLRLSVPQAPWPPAAHRRRQGPAVHRHPGPGLQCGEVLRPRRHRGGTGQRGRPRAAARGGRHRSGHPGRRDRAGVAGTGPRPRRAQPPRHRHRARAGARHRHPPRRRGRHQEPGGPGHGGQHPASRASFLTSSAGQDAAGARARRARCPCAATRPPGTCRR
jgi:His Kinase A (phospho-acceptor) domain